MGNVQPSKLIQTQKLMDVSAIDNLSYLEDGQFAKVYKGHLVINKQAVTIKVPRVPDYIRKEKSMLFTAVILNSTVWHCAASLCLLPSN
jgi:hypothetical protein